jgi:hypothetical protein
MTLLKTTHRAPQSLQNVLASVATPAFPQAPRAPRPLQVLGTALL